MRFKFDENADPRWRFILEQHGHSVSTVTEEKLQEEADATIAAVCRSLGFCLLTLDLDFAQTPVYRPAEHPGLVVLRHPRPTLEDMRALVQQVAILLERETPSGRLWIVEPGRIRIHKQAAGEGEP
jgi:predicted nuclease of predicted toxin-antitoxin system